MTRLKSLGEICVTALHLLNRSDILKKVNINFQTMTRMPGEQSAIERGQVDTDMHMRDGMAIFPNAWEGNSVVVHLPEDQEKLHALPMTAAARGRTWVSVEGGGDPPLVASILAPEGSNIIDLSGPLRKLIERARPHFENELKKAA